MQLNDNVTAAQVAQLNEFLQQGGDLDALLALRHLASAEMRPLSKLAVAHSRDYSANFLPHTMIFSVAPRAKRFEDQLDVRLISGKASLSLEAGTVSGVA